MEGRNLWLLLLHIHFLQAGLQDTATLLGPKGQ